MGVQIPDTIDFEIDNIIHQWLGKFMIPGDRIDGHRQTGNTEDCPDTVRWRPGQTIAKDGDDNETIDDGAGQRMDGASDGQSGKTE